jgi:hypothetical protein
MGRTKGFGEGRRGSGGAFGVDLGWMVWMLCCEMPGREMGAFDAA